MSQVSLNAEVLIISIVAFLIPVMLCLTLWIPLARVNKNIRQWVTESPQRDSFLRWNFWTGSLASIGALLRITVAPATRLNGLQLAIRKGARVQLGLPVVAALAYWGVLLVTKVEPTPAMDNISAVAFLYLQLPGLWLLSRIPQELSTQKHLADSARASIRALRLSTVCWVLGLSLPYTFEAFPAVGALALMGLGIYFGFQYFVQYTQMAVLATFEAWPQEEYFSRAGSLGAILGISYTILILIIALLTPHYNPHLEDGYESMPASTCTDTTTISV